MRMVAPRKRLRPPKLEMQCSTSSSSPGCLITHPDHGHWTEGEVPYIVSVRLKLEELDAKAKR